MTHVLTLANASALVLRGECVNVIADDAGPGARIVLCVNGEPQYELSPDSRLEILASEDCEMTLVLR